MFSFGEALSKAHLESNYHIDRDLEYDLGLKLKESQYGYKLLKEKDDGLFSGSPLGRNAVEYKLDKWVGPKEFCGPLTVYNQLKDVAHAIRLCSDSSLIIYKVKYLIAWGEYMVWYFTKDGELIFDYPWTLHRGIVLAEKVMLLCKVKKEEIDEAADREKMFLNEYDKYYRCGKKLL